LDRSHLLEQIESFIQQEYGLSGTVKRLPGENQNFQIESNDGEHFVLKLAGESLSSEILSLEHRILEHLELADLDLSLPYTIPTKTGNPQTRFSLGEDQWVEARLQGYIAGTSWGEASAAQGNQLRDLGEKLAMLDLALASFDDLTVRRSHPWDLTAASQHRHKLALVQDQQLRQIAEWMFQFYAAAALPNLSSLPHSVIHGDANDENILVEDAEVVGLLDFGDSLFNPTVCELAVTLAYAMLEQADPFQAGSVIVGAYHTVRPLSLPELEVLYPLICGRLCTTVAIAAERRGIDPDHPTWFVTEERAWSLLRKLEHVDPIDAIRQLAAATDLTPYKDNGKSLADLLAKRHQHIGPSLSIAYDEPLTMSKGVGQYLFDDRGRPYLDLVNNVCHVGHCHPRVVEAGQVQMARLNTNTRYLYDGLTDYAQRLCDTLPDPLEVCFFVNSGSEANELALRLAETHTGAHDFIVIDGAYHGHTKRLIDISPYKFMGSGGKGVPEHWVHVVPMPDGYRGMYRGYGHETGKAYGDEVGQVIKQAGTTIAGFIAESLLGCGGQIIPPDGYFEHTFEHVRSAGGLCIIDEVQVGFARAGTHFWAFERQGVVPDIVVMGKPIGNGHPMAAVVTTREVADSFANGMEFFSTFGGNPVSCAIGMAVLDVIEDERMQEHALELGNYFLGGLRELMLQYEIIGDVRGAGLFIGVEFVTDRETLDPAADVAAQLVERMKARGVLLSTDGPLHNVIKIKPPMVLTQDDVDMTLRLMGDELSAVSRIG
jgi:4-aminobutyrate aminotransferase-like enzyme/aminoglycoside phosphotransferase (APT) family kinase protein